NLKEASNRALLPIVLLGLSGIFPLVLPAGYSSVWLGAASPAWQTCLSLLSYEDVRDVFRPGAFDTLAAMHVKSGDSALSAAAACLAGWTASAVAAAWATWAAVRGFDAAVGRPMRPAPRDALPAATGAPPVALAAEVPC